MDDSKADWAITDSGAMACLRCGTCCTRHQAIASLTEARRIARHLDIKTADFVNSYTDPRWHSSKNYLIRHAGGACIFHQYRQEVSHCLIHPVKPACCLEWAPHPTKKECREGLGQTQAAPQQGKPAAAGA